MARWTASISHSLSSGGAKTVHPAAYSSDSEPDNTIQTFHEQTRLGPLKGRCKKMCNGVGVSSDFRQKEQQENFRRRDEKHVTVFHQEFTVASGNNVVIVINYINKNTHPLNTGDERQCLGSLKVSDVAVLTSMADMKLQ